MGKTCFLFLPLFGSYNLPSAGIGMIRATGAAATARAVVIPFGQRAPSTMLGAHLHAFVLLYTSRLLIVLYSPNGVRVQTGTNGVQQFMGNDIPSGTNEYNRSTHKCKGVQTEHNNPRELTSRAAQTGYRRSTNGVQTEHKRIQANTNGVQTITNGI